MHCCPWLESPDFCSPLGQFNGVSWSASRILSLLYSCPGSRCFLPQLCPRVGTRGMQCEYHTTGTIFARLVLCCSLKTYSRIIAIWPTNKNKCYCRIFVTSLSSVENHPASRAFLSLARFLLVKDSAWIEEELCWACAARCWDIVSNPGL